MTAPARVDSSPGKVRAALVGVSGGGLFALLGLPLPWLLGPLAGCAAVGLTAGGISEVPGARKAGQALVGMAIGVRMTPPVVAGAAELLPAIVAVTGAVMALSFGAAHLLRRGGGMDHRTAFFAATAAGMAEMALVAQRHGGDPDAVALVHAVRVTAIVLLVPVVVLTLGTAGEVVEPPSGSAVPPWSFPLLVGAGVATAMGLVRASLPNAWLLGPLLAAVVLAAVDPFPLAVPAGLLVPAQIGIGIALGCRFRREGVRRLPRVAAVAVGMAALYIAFAGGGALLLHHTAGLPLAVGFLAVAPAGMTEMILTAKAMHLEVTTVTAFHVVRIAVITATVGPVFRLSRLLTPGREEGDSTPWAAGAPPPNETV